LPVHSAHIGQEIEVHYRWHPLYGRRVKVRDIKQRGGGREWAATIILSGRGNS
jgi:hypothetical protein